MRKNIGLLYHIILIIFGFIFCFFISYSSFFAEIVLFEQNVISSDYGWVVNEIQFNENYNFREYRSILREWENSHNVVSKPEFMSFVSSNGNYDLKCGEVETKNVKIINLLEVCSTNTLGFLYGLPVEPLYKSQTSCDWNAFKDDSANASYVTLDFAKKVFTENGGKEEEFNVNDVIGKKYFVESGNGDSFEYVINNVLSLESGCGPFLKAIYGDFIVSANENHFKNKCLSLTVCHQGDIISGRDVLHLWDVYNCPIIKSYIVSNSYLQSISNENLLDSYKTDNNGNIVVFIIFFTAFIIVLIFGLIKKTYLVNCYSTLLMLFCFGFVHTCVNIFSTDFLLLRMFNPLFGFIVFGLFVFDLIICLRRSNDKEISK